MEKKEFKQAEIEIIVFDSNEDIVTASITLAGESASGFEP